MRRCDSCGGLVEGRWTICPLCRVPLPPVEADARGAASDEPHPTVPLRFDRRQLWAALVPLSVVAAAASFAAQAVVPGLVEPVRTVWLSLATLWLVVLVAVHRGRHASSLVLWLVVVLSVAAVAWDAVTGWDRWATTWAIPGICAFANVALALVVRLVRLEPEEHIAKAALVMLFGLVPGVFLVLGWVTWSVPALACVATSALLLAGMGLFRRRQLGAALHRRLQA